MANSFFTKFAPFRTNVMIDKIKSHIEEVKAFHADNKEKVEENAIVD